MPPLSSSTGVAITNPLVLYRALLATKRIDPDPAQHRLAIHLQKLYEQLKDYEPIVQYSHRLQQIGRAIGSSPGQNVTNSGADAAGLALRPPGVLSGMFESRQAKDGLALTRVLTNHESAMQMDSPRGLMLHGEVGTGKSMLVDLFADCLPNRKKKRWHFTTFMLETFAKLEQLRRSRQIIIPASLGQQDDYSLLWLARDMISTSPILFLDEFQLPDRASSKIISNLMTSFFHLGGVLIATSNRMPEELAKAAGMEFSPPPSRLESLGWKFGLRSHGAGGKSEAMFGGGKGELAAFLDVLKARCEVWEMEGGKDYRRREAEGSSSATAPVDVDESFDGLHGLAPGNIGLGFEQSASTATKVDETGDASTAASIAASTLPKNYHINPEPLNSLDIWSTLLSTNSDPSSTPVPWTTGTMRVYGRSVIVPRQHSGICAWTFDELCGRYLGPADYVSLAATYHTIILTHVPILSLLQKNEARRLITLLDALYEARCKLLISAAAGPDDIFFPETRSTFPSSTGPTDAIYPETIAEIYQDATAPFRPNISSYGAEAPLEPDYTHARLAALYAAEDQLEDGPPNRPRGASADHGDGISFGRGDAIFGRDVPVAGVDFSRTGVYTGEDERFAYKRARSRLWEMCGARWWAREEEGWWRPVDAAVRRWEGSAGESVAGGVGAGGAHEAALAGIEGMGGARALDEQKDEILFRHGHNASPFRVSQDPPPKFSFTHAWGMMKWGKKAGAWGQGPEGLKDRKKEGDGKN